MALPYDIANSAPHPWDTGKFTSLGPHSVARVLHIAALGPRAFGSTALWQQYAALGRQNVWPLGGKFSSIPRAGVQNYYNLIFPLVLLYSTRFENGFLLFLVINFEPRSLTSLS